MYWKVENNILKQIYFKLPKTTETVSWLDKLNDAELLVHWFYKIILDDTIAKDWQVLKDKEYIIWDENIQEKNIIKNKDIGNYKKEKIIQLSEKTREVITNKYSLEDQSNLSTAVTQIIAYVISQQRWYSDQEKQILYKAEVAKKYIDDHRSNYRTVRDRILTATTYEEIYNLTLDYGINE